MINYCGRDHLVRDWGRHRLECCPPLVFEVVEVPGKGRGLVATKVLEVGDLVVSEKPLLTLKCQPTPRDFRVTMANFEKLTPEKKGVILAMEETGEVKLSAGFCLLNDSEQQMARKFQAYAIDSGLDEDAPSALYEHICLINHSCSPNVFWTDGKETAQEVRVCRRIEVGEEIVAGYYVFSDFPLRQERRDKISRERQFLCHCRLCSLDMDDMQEDDKIRKTIQSLHKEVDRVFNRSGPSKALKLAEEKLALMEKIKEHMILRLPEALLECFNLAALANKGVMVRYKERALELSAALSQGHKEKAEQRIRSVEMMALVN